MCDRAVKAEDSDMATTKLDVEKKVLAEVKNND